MNAGMSSTTTFASTTWSGAGAATGAGGGAGGGGSGESVTLTSTGAAPRPVASRSNGTNPSLSNRNLYTPAGMASNTSRPASVRAVFDAGPVTVTFTSERGAPPGSCTTTAKVT